MMKRIGGSYGSFRGILAVVVLLLGVACLMGVDLIGRLPALAAAWFSPSEAGAADATSGGGWDNLTYTPGEVPVELEEPLAWVGLYWGMPPFSGSQEAFFEGCSWFLGAGKEGGSWTDMGWQVTGDDPGPASLWIALDRATLPPGLCMALIAGVSADTEIHVDLLDDSGAVVAADVLGNLAADPDDLAGGHVFPLPFEVFEQATALRLRRGAGEVSLLVTLFSAGPDAGPGPEQPADPVALPTPFCPATQAVIDAINPSWLNGGVPGRLLVEVWRNVPGDKLRYLHDCIRFPAYPDERSYADTTKLGSIGDNYGRRIRGTITPAASGVYRFRLAGDDESELWLSADATPFNISRIAHVPGWTDPEQFGKYPSQLSPGIPMEAGVPRYIEILQKEKHGGDHVTVQWRLDGGTWSVIGTEALHSFVQPEGWVVDTWSPYLGARTETWTSTAREDGLEQLISGETKGWVYSDGAIHTLGLRSALSFTLETGPGIYAVEIEGFASNGSAMEIVGFPIEVFSDGLSLGRGIIHASPEKSGCALFFLPHRDQSGEVSITLRLLGIDPSHHLAVTAVRLVSFEGEEWQERRRQDASSSRSIPGSSFTSPAFIEGRARWLERLTLTAGGSVITANRGLGHNWYAEIPLSTDAPTAVSVLDAEGGSYTDHEIIWKPWDLSQETPETDFLVRVNEAMHFTAPGDLMLHVNGVTQDENTPLSHREQGLADGLYRYRLRGLCGEDEGPWMLSDNDCEVALTARPAQIADSFWGDNFVDMNQRLRGAHIRTITDLNGDGVEDYRRTRSFDETTPLSPDVSMPGKSTRFYGGIQATNYGTNIDYPFHRYTVRNVAGDPIQIGPSIDFEGEKSLYGAVVWLASDFLDVDAGGHATFASQEDMMTLSVASVGGAMTPAFRFLVKTGGQYYVSSYQDDPSGRSGATILSLDNPEAATWAPYDPATNLVFEAATASFSKIAFDAIEAVGYYFERGPAEAPVVFSNHGLSVHATIVSCLPAPAEFGALAVPVSSSTGRPTIRWTAIEGATGYELQRARHKPDLGQWGEWETVCVNEVGPQRVVFGQEGTYHITGEWEENGTLASGMLVVRAVSSAFNPNTALWINRPRLWTQPGLAPEVHMECDEGLLLNEQLPPPNDERAFILGAKRTGSYVVLGRLGGPKGPVLCKAEIEAFDLLSTNQTGITFTGEWLPDGSRILSMPISAGDLPEGALIRVWIFVAGVTFEDGSTEMWISADDLDADGMITVRFIYPAGQPTSVCHKLEVWQGGEIIAQR